MGAERLPNESVEYCRARADLEAAEVELMEQRERVVALRRALPAGPSVGKFRGMGLMSPVWNFFDVTPEGRSDFLPRRGYEAW